MSEIKVEREVAAPAERVWELITDLDGSVERLSGVESVERVSGPDFGVGTRWRETRKMFGKEATEEMEVASVDPGRSYTVTARSGGANYTSVLGVEPRGQDSLLWMSFGAEPEGLLPKLLGATVGRLFEGTTKKMIEGDLADIAAAAESSGS